ncbi:MAG: hypothetical protein IPP42_01280 [Saprospiraceae bacterium]|nr:hypothetical protein [Saprospiraceae bacterium]
MTTLASTAFQNFIFEKSELASIQDSTFILRNWKLYNFAHALFYYNQARLLFDTKKDTNRQGLLAWVETLSNAIKHYNQSQQMSFKENAFYSSIGFEDKYYPILKKDIVQLKEKFTPYFNQDIYSDFKRLFYSEKNSNTFILDSLEDYAELYNLQLSSEIVYNKSNLPLIWILDDDDRAISQPHKAFRDTINQQYSVDMALDLISRFLQLNYFANKVDSICEKATLTILYQTFKDDLRVYDPDNFSTHKGFYSNIPKDDFFEKR